jgi:hypothetical protein
MTLIMVALITLVLMLIGVPIVFNIVFFSVLVVLVAFTGYYTKYTFKEDGLAVKFPLALLGALSFPSALLVSHSKFIPYTEVNRIAIGRKWITHGLSTHCVIIDYGKYGQVGVSPVNEDEFIRILRGHCPRARF